LLGVEPSPLLLGVEGLASVLCPGFPNPTRDGISAQTVRARSLGQSVPDDSQISSGIANHKSQFPSGIILTWNPDNSTVTCSYTLLSSFPAICTSPNLSIYVPFFSMGKQHAKGWAIILGHSLPPTLA
jgi:hypothetical protein